MPQPGMYLPDGAAALPKLGAARRKALFLDRDGVININHGYVCSTERTEWVPGIFDLCMSARNAGHVLVVVTNQAGIARGYFTETEFLDYTRWIHDEFEARGLGILATLYCPHHPTAGVGELCVECRCRKPASGMFMLASELFDLVLGESVMVGDKESDLQAASGAGIIKNFLVNSANNRTFDEVINYLDHSS